MTESHTRWLAAQFKVIAWHRWFFLFNYIRNNNNKLCINKTCAARGARVLLLRVGAACGFPGTFCGARALYRVSVLVLRLFYTYTYLYLFWL
tara:strand:+ start:839 stop:1114 length:276 start_codon:yes stop_codon:yes gene_type:complete